jgi:hypothetical protein
VSQIRIADSFQTEFQHTILGQNGFKIQKKSQNLRTESCLEVNDPKSQNRLVYASRNSIFGHLLWSFVLRFWFKIWTKYLTVKCRRNQKFQWRIFPENRFDIKKSKGARRSRKFGWFQNKLCTYLKNNNKFRM